MPTIRLQLDLTLDDATAKTLAELLAPAIKLAIGPTPEEERRQARLTASRNAIYGGQTPTEDELLLIDSRRAAKLLGISERTL